MPGPEIEHQIARNVDNHIPAELSIFKIKIKGELVLTYHHSLVFLYNTT